MPCRTVNCNDDATGYMCDICSPEINGRGKVKFKRLTTALRASRGLLAYAGYNCNEVVIASFFSGTPVSVVTYISPQHQIRTRTKKRGSYEHRNPHERPRIDRSQSVRA